MPRKKSPEGKATDKSGVELKAVRLELPMDIHRKLRVAAAKHEQSMATFARHIIEDYLSGSKAPKSKPKPKIRP